MLFRPKLFTNPKTSIGLSGPLYFFPLPPKANAKPGQVYERSKHVADLPSAAAATAAALHEPTGHESAAATGHEPAALRSAGRSAEVLDATEHATKFDESDGSAEFGHAVQ